MFAGSVPECANPADLAPSEMARLFLELIAGVKGKGLGGRTRECPAGCRSNLTFAL